MTQTDGQFYSVNDVYFSVADRRVSSAVGVDGFTRALIHAILFDSRVVIPDIFFFNSPGVRDHIFEAAGGRSSLLQTALTRGFVVPSLRRGARNFREVESYLRQGGIHGMLSPAETTKIADYLDDVHPPRETFAALWPDALGLSYGALLEDLLQTTDPPLDGTSLRDSDLWTETRDLRFDAIGLAREHRRKAGGSDIRRGEVINEAGRILGVLDKGQGVGDSDDVLVQLERTGAGPGDRRFEAAVAFFEWLDELYHFNQADRMGIQPTLTNGRPSTLAVLSRAYQRPQYVSRLIVPNRPPASFDVTLTVPSLAQLKRLDAKTLLDLREYGSTWRVEAKAYMENPSAITRHAAEQAIEAYAEQLRSRVRSRILQLLQVTTFSGVVLGGTTALVDGMTNLLHHDVPVAAVATVLTTGLIVTRYLRHSGDHEEVVRRRTLEAIPPSRLRTFQLPDPDLSN